MVHKSTQSNAERVPPRSGGVLPAVITVGDLFHAVSALMARTGSTFPIPALTTESAGYLSHLLTPLLRLDDTTREVAESAAHAQWPLRVSVGQLNIVGFGRTTDDESISDTVPNSPVPSPVDTSTLGAPSATPDEALSDWSHMSNVLATIDNSSLSNTAAVEDGATCSRRLAGDNAHSYNSITTAAIEAFNGQDANVNPEEDDPDLRWYAVTVGLNIGVFAHWPTVAPLVVGVSGACYVRFRTRLEARRAFIDAIARGAVRVVTPPAAFYPTATIFPGNGGDDGNNGPSGGAGAAGAAGAVSASA